MSANPRFWYPTSFEYAYISPNSLGQHHPSSFSVPPAATLPNVDNVASRQTVNPAGRKTSSQSIAGASANVRFPQQYQQQTALREQTQSQRGSPSLTSASILTQSTGTQHQQSYMIPSPVISAPSTPLLLAKELPLAPPSVPQTPSSHTLSSSTSNNTVNSANANVTPALSSVHPDMYHHPRPAPQFRYRHAHSRSSSFSSTNNVTFPSVSISSVTTTTTPSPGLSSSSPIVQPATPVLSTPMPSPVTPLSNNPSRRTSLITSALANSIATPTSSTGGGVPVSAPMSPSSSYGLPSPTFPPRPLPSPIHHHTAHAHASAPIRPPRSPARVAGLISPLTNIASLPAPPSNAPSSPALVSQPIPRARPPATGMTGTTAQLSGSMSRRNSRQVSVRLSTAFYQAPSVPVSRSVSRSRAVSTTTEDIYVNTVDDRLGFGHLITSRRGSAASAYSNGAGQVEVLRPGDIIGQGCLLHGEVVRAVSGGLNASKGASAGIKYEVVRSLGTGSYAVVYLVREMLPPSPPNSANSSKDFDEDVFGLVQPPTPFVYSLATRSLSNRSTTTRRTSLLKPIEERPSPSSSSLPSPSPSSPLSAYTYGKEFAIKVLSKSNLDSDELAVQMTEPTIHQSLKVHPNIVTLHRTLETDALLLLVLEYVPGEDLYYFLEQQQKEKEGGDVCDDNGSVYSVSSSGRAASSSHGLDSDTDVFYDEEDGEPVRGRRPHRRHHHRGRTTTYGGTDGEELREEGSGTPPTPGLLSSIHPAHMLSRGRLRLIARMFSQMCDAVQACHAQGIAHRDIKPENFIVTSSSACSNSNSDEQKVIVKLSDFGLATTEKFSADVDCGSAPYMSYECRNLVGPTYAAQPADVWSLGIVLINMLYHHNLWQDTFEGDEFFEAFRQQPVAFLMERSPGMTRDVAEFLAERVFRILPDCPSADASIDPEAWAKYEQDVARARVSAAEFGEWVRNLPSLFYNNTTGAVAGGAGSGSAEKPVAVVTTAATPDSPRSSFHNAATAGLTHSPGCVYSQLAAIAVDAENEEDEAEVEAMFADKTFTQADARQDFFDREDWEDDNVLHHAPLILPNAQSSPPTANSIPRPPRFQPPSSPPPSEPMPLAQSTSEPKFVDGDASVVMTLHGECIACSHDEHFGLDATSTREDSKRSPSGGRVRRRGRRKKDHSVSGITGVGAGAGIGASSAPASVISSPNPVSVMNLPVPTNLDDLAQDTQNLARELSRAKPQPIPQPRSTSRSRSRAPTTSYAPAPPIPPLPTSPPTGGIGSSPSLNFPIIDPSTPSLPPSVAASVAPTKKSSKWNLLSWRDRGDDPRAASERAATILKELDSKYYPLPPPSASTSRGSKSQTSSSSSHYSSYDSSASGHRFSVASSVSTAATTASSASSIAFVPPPLSQATPAPTSAGSDVSSNGTAWRERGHQQQRNGWDSASPPSRGGLHEFWDRSPGANTYNGRTNAASVASWRKDQNAAVPVSAVSSMYNGSSGTGGTSSSESSTFTRFGNGSEMSFSTVATTMSASLGFNMGGTAGVLGQQLRDKKLPQSPPAHPHPPSKPNSPLQPKQQRHGVPPNVKFMTGIPWELDELPRQMHPTVNGKMPMGNIHGAPPPRRGHRNGVVPPKPPPLDTITERPKGPRRPTSPDPESAESEGSGSPVEHQQQQQRKKVLKAQGNTLAKLLTSFKPRRD